jgi:hypothetical protein
MQLIICRSPSGNSLQIAINILNSSKLIDLADGLEEVEEESTASENAKS